MSTRMKEGVIGFLLALVLFAWGYSVWNGSASVMQEIMAYRQENPPNNLDLVFGFGVGFTVSTLLAMGVNLCESIRLKREVDGSKGDSTSDSGNGGVRVEFPMYGKVVDIRTWQLRRDALHVHRSVL